MRDVTTTSPPLIPQGDEAVQNTTDDAASSKWSSSSHGYFEDPYLRYFVQKPTRRAPLINRGYYARVAAIRKYLSQFINCFPEDCTVQVVNLGAGLDTTSFWTLESWSNVSVFECDFPEIIFRKASIILDNPALWTKITNRLEDIGLGLNKEIKAPRFTMVSTDLRRIGELQNQMNNTKFNPMYPTIFICECVLVYMEPMYSDAVIEWAASAVSAPHAMLIYEQVNPNDSFGRVMTSNLEARGCPLLGIHKYPTIESQRNRYLKLKWSTCKVADMNDVYDLHIDRNDRLRIEKLEMFDEFEEWRLIQAHYILVVALSPNGFVEAHPKFNLFKDNLFATEKVQDASKQ